MNLFELLPNELIVAQCEQLDAVSLAKMSEAYSRVYYVCKDILKRKTDEYQVDQKINGIMEDIKNTGFNSPLYGFDVPDGFELELRAVKNLKEFSSFVSEFHRSFDLEIQIRYIYEFWMIDIYAYDDQHNEIARTGRIIHDPKYIFNVIKELMKNGSEPHPPIVKRDQ